MPRKPRLHLPCGLYHVILVGVHCGSIKSQYRKPDPKVCVIRRCVLKLQMARIHSDAVLKPAHVLVVLLSSVVC